jgi:uncharacterized sporulation protein YeaH/YhbH (DUF444 family)
VRRRAVAGRCVSEFAGIRASERDQIYPVFRDLFKKEGASAW